MTLITRLGRLFRADLNAVLDGLEEPAALLKQALRDMEEIVAGEDVEHSRLSHEATRLTQALEDGKARTMALDDELSLCLAANKDELARNLVRRKLEAARHEAALNERQQTLRDAQSRLAAHIREHRQRLDALRAQAAMTDSVSAVTRDEISLAWQTAATISDADIEVALLREKQRRAQS